MSLKINIGAQSVTNRNISTGLKIGVSEQIFILYLLFYDMWLINLLKSWLYSRSCYQLSTIEISTVCTQIFTTNRARQVMIWSVNSRSISLSITDLGGKRCFFRNPLQFWGARTPPLSEAISTYISSLSMVQSWNFH